MIDLSKAKQNVLVFVFTGHLMPSMLDSIMPWDYYCTSFMPLKLVYPLEWTLF
jgi:hypothetical protein